MERSADGAMFPQGADAITETIRQAKRRAAIMGRRVAGFRLALVLALRASEIAASGIAAAVAQMFRQSQSLSLPRIAIIYLAGIPCRLVPEGFRRRFSPERREQTRARWEIGNRGEQNQTHRRFFSSAWLKNFLIPPNALRLFKETALRARRVIQGF
jgi:hypothetical protein